MKKQIIFSKDGRLRFVGHLDMMRTMQRAMTRAGIKLSYSQGFNPHPHMSFASPLALGASGENEIMEIRIENEMSDREIFENLSRELPNGLHVKAVRTIPDTQRNPPPNPGGMTIRGSCCPILLRPSIFPRVRYIPEHLQSM